MRTFYNAGFLVKVSDRKWDSMTDEQMERLNDRIQNIIDQAEASLREIEDPEGDIVVTITD